MSSSFSSQMPCIKFAFDNPKYADKVLVIAYKSNNIFETDESSSSQVSKKRKFIDPSQYDLQPNEHVFTTIHVNSMILAAFSEMFYNLCHSPMVESQSSFVVFVADNEDKANAIYICLQVVYGHDLPSTISLHSLFDVILMSEQYGFVNNSHNNESCQVLNKCFKRLLQISQELQAQGEHEKVIQFFSLPSIMLENWLQNPVFKQIHSIGCKSLIHIYQPQLSTMIFRPSEIFNFYDLSVHTVCEILSSSELATTSDNIIYQLAKFWLAHQLQKNLNTSIISRVFECIRFPLCSKQFLMLVVENDKFFVYLYEKHRWLERQKETNNSNESVIQNPEKLVSFIKSIHPNEPEIVSDGEKCLHLKFIDQTSVVNCCKGSSSYHLASNGSFLYSQYVNNKLSVSLDKKLKQAYTFYSISSSSEASNKFLEIHNIETRTSCSNDLEKALHTMEFSYPVLVPEAPSIFFSPVFFVDGFPVVLEGSLINADHARFVAMYLYCFIGQSNLYKTCQIHRKFFAFSNVSEQFMCRNETTSTFKIHAENPSMSAFGMQKYLCIEGGANNEFIQNGVMRLKGEIEIVDFCV
jgi:hypothetical protein